MAALGTSCASAEDPCNNTCALPGIEQICATGGIATCTEFADGCLHYGKARDCSDGRVCQQTGEGEAVCVAACPFSCVVGTSTCEGNLLKTCVEGAGGCPEYDAGVQCAANTRCDGDMCIDDSIPCENDCPMPGAVVCDANNALRDCAEFDTDACLDFGPPTACQQDEICLDGGCLSNCTDECTSAGARRCDPLGTAAFEQCEDISGCLTWSDPSACGPMQRCDNGMCVDEMTPCTDDCMVAGNTCSNNSVVECGQLDADSCLDLGAPTPCGMTEVCSNGVCSTPGAQLFFSEYVEGDSDNKAVEIYNPGGAIVLSRCSVQRYSNGNATPVAIPLNATTLNTGNVYLLCNGAASFSASCDQVSGTLSHNGNDALELICDNTTLDVFGQIGMDPGTEWGSDPTASKDTTLRRKCTVLSGDSVGSDAFDPATEWDGFPMNTFDGLGMHTTCAP